MKHGLLIKYLNFLSDHNSSIFPCNNSPWRISTLQSNFFWNPHSNMMNSTTTLWIFVRRVFHSRVICVDYHEILRQWFLSCPCRNFNPLILEFHDVCWILSFLLESKIKPSFFFQYRLPILLILFDCFVNFFFYIFTSQCLWFMMKHFNVIDPFNLDSMINCILKYEVVTIPKTQPFINIS